MQLSAYTRALLDDIERRIDPEIEEDYRNQWKTFWYTDMDVPVFTPSRSKVTPPSVELKHININDALNDFELMLDSELVTLSHQLGSKSSGLCIRANYGTGILPSLFGAKIFVMPYETNTLPTTRQLGENRLVRDMLEKGVPDLQNGFGKDVLYFGERCAEIFEQYPKIKAYTSVYHPDLQGPLDVAELLWGGEMFYQMYDDPDFVHDVMRLITDTYKVFMEKWYSYIPKNVELSNHWNMMHRGALVIRLDSAMNISNECYTEYSKPYDQELFDYFGGGVLHFCGRGDHYVESLCEIEGLYGIHMTQPHLNNMETILNAASKHNMRMVCLPNACYYAKFPMARVGMIHT